MKHLLTFLALALLCTSLAFGQTAVVSRNVVLHSGASSDSESVAKLMPGTQIVLLEPDPTHGYYHVRTTSGKIGYVWGKSVHILPAGASSGSSSQPVSEPSAHPALPASGQNNADLAQSLPAPLLAKNHPVDWWFVFKFNSAVFPGCGGAAARACPFGGKVQNYKAFSQQFVYASSEARTLKEGTDCLGDTTDDPLGATFEQVYDGSFYYIIWNDQFYDDPGIQGCTTSCSAPWGHSKGMLAWNDAGSGFVLQVTTPSFPAAGSNQFPRKTDGNTLGCVNDNNVQVSQHFFALKLMKDDVVKVLTALHNASVVTDPQNPQIVRNGGPADIQNLVKTLGSKSNSHTFTKDVLSTGVELISKPSTLNVPPWQMVSAVLGGVPLRAATWWASPKIYSTTASSAVTCWDESLAKPGAVEIATTGHWAGKEIGLAGGLGTNFNHAKIGVSTSGDRHYSIFGDMNQQGSLSGPNCSRSQNGRGGLFYVFDDADLSQSLTSLISGNTAPTQ